MQKMFLNVRQRWRKKMCLFLEKFDDLPYDLLYPQHNIYAVLFASLANIHSSLSLMHRSLRNTVVCNKHFS